MALWIVRSHLIAKPAQRVWNLNSTHSIMIKGHCQKRKKNVPSKNEMKDFEIKVTSKLWSEKWNSIVTWVHRNYLRVFLKSSFSFLWFLWNTWLHLGEQGWRSTGESVRLPPMWPGLDCYARHPNQQCLLYGKIRWNINPLTFCISRSMSGSELFEEGPRGAPVRVRRIRENFWRREAENGRWPR